MDINTTKYGLVLNSLLPYHVLTVNNMLHTKLCCDMGQNDTISKIELWVFFPKGVDEEN